jgi:N-methylhydantoinase B/oxoprolinase/acetone carboxylase alpha subunit
VFGDVTTTKNTPIEALERAFPLRVSQPWDLAGGELGAVGENCRALDTYRLLGVSLAHLG